MKPAAHFALAVALSCFVSAVATADAQKPLYAMFQISAGGPWSQTYTADVDTPGVTIGPGTTSVTALSTTIDTSQDPDAAPQSVYLSDREGPLVRYTFTGLQPDGLYNVRLHFCASKNTAGRGRVFDVILVGQFGRKTILRNFSPSVSAGDPDHAIERVFQTHADSSGMITLIGTSKPVGDAGNAAFNGIEIVPTDLPDAVPAGALDVRKFGAKGDGVADDGPGIQRAIDAAESKGAGGVVTIPSGHYLVATTIKIEHSKNLTIRGVSGAVLVGATIHTNVMQLNSNSGLTIGHLTVQYPLGYTQGMIDAVDLIARTVDVTVELGYPNLDNPLFADPAHDRIHPFTFPETHTYEQDTGEPDTKSLQQIGSRAWRLTLNGPPQARWAGKRFLICDFSNGAALSGDHNTDTTVEDVTVHGGGACLPYFFQHTDGTFTFRHFDIGARPGTDDLAGSNGGGQFASSRGTTIFEDCDFSKGDDDGFDGHSSGYQRVLRQIDPRTVQLQIATDYQIGDTVSLVDWTTMSERSRAHVVSAVNNTDGTCTVALDAPLQVLRAGPGTGDPWGTDALHDGIDRVIDCSDAGISTVFRHDRMSELRARPINTKMRNCIIENNYFYDCEIFAVEAGPEFYWEEGPSLDRLSVIHNQFNNCNEANVCIGMFNAPSTCVSTDNRNIVIKGNRFENYGAHVNAYSGPLGAVWISNTRNVDIENNDFGDPASPSAPGVQKLSVMHCANVTVKNNKGLPQAQQP
jgi:hypothetical protein